MQPSPRFFPHGILTERIFTYTETAIERFCSRTLLRPLLMVRFRKKTGRPARVTYSLRYCSTDTLHRSMHHDIHQLRYHCYDGSM
jgi:hypothetical protein